MDFFGSQEFARRRTKWLVGLFVLAVVLIILTVYLAVVMTLFGAGIEAGEGVPRSLWDPEIFLAVSVITVLIILAGSLFKISELSAGGEAVARMLGARIVDQGARDAGERRLLNVVEEMAIAAGVPVPAVYVMPGESGINAFAAGFGTEDAVVAVTEGAMRILSRDELQGVIGHEFSHILNGDMRLNIRLMGFLHGILLISMIGYMLMRASRGRSKKGGQIVLLGLSLYIIGYIGIFLGRVIKAAVSRQREYLADASSVQFTRNPGGIAGALKKIGGLALGSRLNVANAEEASHLFFGNALKGSLFGLTATHPPLVDRIRRIDPSFDGDFPPVKLSEGAVPGEGPVEERAAAGLARARKAAVIAAAGVAALDPGRVADRVGRLDRDHLDYASGLLARINPNIRDRAREPAGAQAIIFALLFERAGETRRRQLSLLERSLEPFLREETLALIPMVEAMPREARLPLIDMVVPALRRLSGGQYQTFHQVVRELATADERIDLFEYTLQHVLLRHVAPAYSASRPPGVRYHSLSGLASQCSILLSVLAHHGQQNAGEAGKAFAAGAGRLGPVPPKVLLHPREDCGLKSLDASLRELACAAPPLRRKLVEAAAACIIHDRKVTLEEGELLRAISDSLDCPLPPFIPGQEI